MKLLLSNKLIDKQKQKHKYFYLSIPSSNLSELIKHLNLFRRRSEAFFFVCIFNLFLPWSDRPYLNVIRSSIRFIYIWLAIVLFKPKIFFFEKNKWKEGQTQSSKVISKIQKPLNWIYITWNYIPVSFEEVKTKTYFIHRFIWFLIELFLHCTLYHIVCTLHVRIRILHLPHICDTFCYLFYFMSFHVP